MPISQINWIFFKIFSFALFALIFTSCLDNPVTDQDPPIEDIPEPVQPDNPVDFNVGWIERLPKMEFVEGSSNPAREGWPAEGQQITWRAHVKIWGNDNVENVRYRWLLDGEEVHVDVIDLESETYVSVELNMIWSFQRRELTFEIDHTEHITEESEENNTVTIFTDALSVGFYVEQGIYDYFHEHQHKLGTGSNSFEDWAQRQMNKWNEAFENAVFPSTPDGVLDRVRLDELHIVEDGALPLAENASFFEGQGSPDTENRNVDLQWGFVSSTLSNPNHLYQDHTTVENNNDFYFSGFVFHEVLHVRYLIHPQIHQVNHNFDGGFIDIKEGNQLAVNTDFMPKAATFPNTNDGIIHFTKYTGIMSSVGNKFLGELSAAALNYIAGERPRFGNFHVPSNFGEFRDLIPEQNQIQIVDADGNVLPQANVKIYQHQNSPNFREFYDDQADFELTADNEGKIEVDKDVFGVKNIEPLSQTLIVRVETDTELGYTFFEKADANIQYMSGNETLGEYVLEVDLKAK